MKKTRFTKMIVLFCIMLSFFNSMNMVKAAIKYTASKDFGSLEVKTNVVDSNGNTKTVMSNVVSTSQSADGTMNITATNTSNMKYTNFYVKEPGVYQFDVTGLSQYEQEQLYYSLQRNGRAVRLAAYQTEDGYFKTYSSSTPENPNTSVCVYLYPGEYSLSLDQYNASSSHSGKYEGTYNVAISKINTEGQVVGQTPISSAYVSQNNTKNLNLEEEVADYAIPEDQTIFFEYDKATIWDKFGNMVGQVANGVVTGVSDFVEEYVANPLEETICELMLGAGDFFVKIMDDIIGSEVTVTALVYNEIDAVNPNFFDKAVSGSGLTADVKTSISKWYDFLKLIAVAVYLVALLAIGVQILYASTGNGMQKGKELLSEWVKGILILTFMPFAIKYAFKINEALVTFLRDSVTSSVNTPGTTFGGDSDDWSAEEVEFRSPEYVSRYTGTIAFGSDEMSLGYMKKIPVYEQRLDLMRIMRAYAGVTKKFVYAIIWWILIAQLLTFIVMYYKRFFMIAFLIAMFPFICVFQGIEAARGRKGPQLNSWARELFTNIFMQTIQAIIYTIITSVCVSAVQISDSSAALNWIIIILAINFVAEGEKLLRKILGAAGSTAEDAGRTGQGIKGAMHKAKDQVGKIVGRVYHHG